MVKQNLFDILIIKIYLELAKKNIDTNKLLLKHIGTTWSLDPIDMTVY